MILSGLPKEVTEVCVPILAKYGICDSKQAGRVLKGVGQAFKDSAFLLRVGKNTRAQLVLAEGVDKTLAQNGIKNHKHRIDCAKELLEALMEVYDREVVKKNE
jgi:hypothetical protein